MAPLDVLMVPFMCYILNLGDLPGDTEAQISLQTFTILNVPSEG